MLDYEQMPNIHLGIGVKNQAEFHHSVASRFRMHSTPVRIQVINVREGPTFNPNSMTFSVQEGVRGDSLMNYVLGTYTAVDLDTGNPATNVRYHRPFAVLEWQRMVPSTAGSWGMCLSVWGLKHFGSPVLSAHLL